MVLNVQKEINPEDNSTKYVYREVGSWNNENRLVLNLSIMTYPNEIEHFRSVCSEQCKFGHVKV